VALPFNAFCLENLPEMGDEMNEIAQVVPVSARADTSSKELSNKIGKMLVTRGKITREEFKSIITVQNEQNLRFGDAAVQLGLVGPEDVEAVLAEQFAYTVPPDRNTTLDSRLIAAFRPDSQQAEALRSLRSELLLRYFNRGEHLSLAVVGAENATGIALTAANLAISFAQLGKRTLLVDGNLRSSQLHALFGLNERNPGLTDLIAARALVEPIGVPDLGSLWVVAAGTQAPNPQELLAGKQYADRLQDLATHFEVIIINTPPLNHIADGRLIASHSGAALLVAQEDVSRMQDLETICTSLRSLGVRLLGAALQQ
jgi:protein-tyrosine kinase